MSGIVGWVGSRPMSFWRSQQLLARATLTAARHTDITLDDVTECSRCSQSTVQRLLRKLEDQFPDVTASADSEGNKRWRLPSATPHDLLRLCRQSKA